ncbi:MAG TPA: carboxypeptidase-like regulatory domain-containing protein [Candidatus Angelobacter sp.]|nr:carboxypeptidase-like regulatory domain-containing protein [Candidatus Angelobacter sp.]
MRLHCVALLGTALSFSQLALAQSQPSPSPSLSAQTSPTPSPEQEVPVIDGRIGPCSAAFTVTDANGKPVYAATVNVHITYGFGGFKKMDLEASTNAQGKVTFKGLPAKVHNPPLEFHASKGDLVGMATDDPVVECQATHDIVLEKAKPKQAPTN